MQLSEIKTVEQAKALAFDAIQRIEIEQNNLRALQQRIVELSEGGARGLAGDNPPLEHVEPVVE